MTTSPNMTRRTAVTTAALTAIGVSAGAFAQATPSAETRAFTDYLDRDVQIPANPQRVITLSLPILEIALSVGITPVGSASFATMAGFPEALAEQAEDIELVGDKEWDFEKIITLEPDLAIVDYFGDQDADALAILEQIVPVVTVGEFRENWRDDSAMVAAALNRSDDFAAVEQVYDERVAALTTALAPEWKGASVAVVRFRAEDMRVLKGNSFAGTVLADLGLASPDLDDSGAGIAVDFSMENTAPLEVDALFLVHDSGPDAERNFNDTIASPVFGFLNVVDSGHTYLVSQEIWIAMRGYGAASVIHDDIERYLVDGEPGITIPA